MSIDPNYVPPNAIRSMRVIAWKGSDGTSGYTLIMEWSQGGMICRDQRYLMTTVEFDGLVRSIEEVHLK